MKKILSLTAMVLLAVCLLTACNFTTNFSDSLGTATAESTEKVTEMLQALAEGDTESALSLLHPDVTGDAADAVTQMCGFLAGRTAVELNQTGARVNASTGTSGKTRQEVTNFQVILDDGTEIYVAATHYTDQSGAGFTSFQLVMGIV